MQKQAQQDRCEPAERCSNTAWKRVCGRTMQRMTQVSQKWRKAMHDMHKTITQATKQLLSWYQDSDGTVSDSGNDTNDTGASNRRARRKQCHPQRGLARGSTPLVSNGLETARDNDDDDDGMSMSTNNKTTTTITNIPQQLDPHSRKCYKRGADGEHGATGPITRDHHNGEGCADKTVMMGKMKNKTRAGGMTTDTRRESNPLESRVRWANECGQVLCRQHVSQRTHYRYDNGRVARRPCPKRMSNGNKREGWTDEDLAIKHARKRAAARTAKRTERRERQAKTWTTFT